jgi:hypothetical protein
MSISNERIAVQATIWDNIPDETWLNAPGRIRTAEQAISQLVVAQSLGFAIPSTILSNSMASITDQLPEGNISVKMINGRLFGNNGIRGLGTTVVKNSPDIAPPPGVPFPGIWQEHLAKAREWRITIVDEDVFPVAIYTTAEAKDDWRRLQRTSAVTFKHEDQFPDSETEKCFKLLGHYGLKYGAFDFIEKPDGSITYLELNPNGQYMWLEKDLGLPISQSIASSLMRIAKANS